MTPRQIIRTSNFAIPLAATAVIGVFGTVMYLAERTNNTHTTSNNSREATPFENAVCDAYVVNGKAEKGFAISNAIEKQNVVFKLSLEDSAGQEQYLDTKLANSTTSVYNELFARLNPGKNTRVITIGENYNVPLFDRHALSLDIYKLSEEKIGKNPFARSPADRCYLRLDALNTPKNKKGE